MSATTKRLRGLANMVRDAVDHGSTAIQRVHLATAARPFRVLEAVPAVRDPAKVAHTVYDAVVSLTYANVRLVNRAVGLGIDLALDEAEKHEPDPEAHSTHERPPESGPTQ
ncbi:MAG: hypothetical protein Q8P18_21105 [Pseudomonadota bacterium]|nr:hypothetical protein [Pseudomonadota bacterium]